MMKPNKILCNNKGFTLIELMVVVIIIGILAAIAVPQFTKQSANARQKSAMADLKSLKNATEIYYAEYAAYPESNIAEALALNGITWSNLYDPWQEPYKYYYFTATDLADDQPFYYFATSDPPDGPVVYCSQKQDPTTIDDFSEPDSDDYDSEESGG